MKALRVVLTAHFSCWTLIQLTTVMEPRPWLRVEFMEDLISLPVETENLGFEALLFYMLLIP